MNKAQLLKYQESHRSFDPSDRELIRAVVLEVFRMHQTLFNQEYIWVSLRDYAKYHGLSSKTVYRAIESGRISEKNGGLAFGSSKPKARKRLNRLFDIELGRVHIPL